MLIKRFIDLNRLSRIYQNQASSDNCYEFLSTNDRIPLKILEENLPGFQ